MGNTLETIGLFISIASIIISTSVALYVFKISHRPLLKFAKVALLIDAASGKPKSAIMEAVNRGTMDCFLGAWGIRYPSKPGVECGHHIPVERVEPGRRATMVLEFDSAFETIMRQGLEDYTSIPRLLRGGPVQKFIGRLRLSRLQCFALTSDGSRYTIRAPDNIVEFVESILVRPAKR